MPLPDFDLSLFVSSDWNQCVAAFLRSVYSTSESRATLRNYRSVLCHFFTSQDKLPPAYSRLDIETYMHSLCIAPRARGNPPTAATCNARLRTLSSFYRFAATFLVNDLNGIAHPLLTVPAPTVGIRYGTAPRRPRGLTEADLSLLFSVIPKDTEIGARDRAAFVLLLWTGRRRSEIARMRYGDIESTTLVDENGLRRTGWLYWYTGKGHGTQRTAKELPKYAYQAIETYLTMSGRKATIQPTDPLFVATVASRNGPAGTQPLSESALDYRLHTYLRLAGLEHRQISLHAFRHTAAQNRWQAGQTLLSLRRFLDHVSLETTRIYLESLVGTSDPEAELLESRFAKFSA